MRASGATGSESVKSIPGIILNTRHVERVAQSVWTKS